MDESQDDFQPLRKEPAIVPYLTQKACCCTGEDDTVAPSSLGLYNFPFPHGHVVPLGSGPPERAALGRPQAKAARCGWGRQNSDLRLNPCLANRTALHRQSGIVCELGGRKGGGFPL